MKRPRNCVRGFFPYCGRMLFELGGGSTFLACHLLFRAEPIFQFVAVFSASFLVECVGAEADLVFEFNVLWLACLGCRLFLLGVWAHGVKLPWAQTYASTHDWSIA